MNQASRRPRRNPRRGAAGKPEQLRRFSHEGLRFKLAHENNHVLPIPNPTGGREGNRGFQPKRLLLCLGLLLFNHDPRSSGRQSARTSRGKDQSRLTSSATTRVCRIGRERIHGIQTSEVWSLCSVRAFVANHFWRQKHECNHALGLVGKSSPPNLTTVNRL